MKAKQVLLAAILASVIGAPMNVSAEDIIMVRHMTLAAVEAPDEGEAPPLDGATAWLNSRPLTAADLRGKVVLVGFWNYTCINWIRQLPYLRAWAEKYRDQGLVVIGVHSPEFGFEKDLANVRRAAEEMRVDYPIAIDSEHAIWDAFKNEYWPALYFIDARGHIRHHQFGEGEYEQSEMIVRQLLAEAGAVGISGKPASVDAPGVEAAADWGALESPETYVGYERAENFAPPGGVVRDKPHVYMASPKMILDHWSLSGDWTVGAESIVLNEANGRIAYRFHARDLHLVLAPPTGGGPVRFRVTLDGAPPGADHGVDVDAEGWGSASEPRLYQLVRQSGAVADRTFEIEFVDPGVRAFAFTFG